MDLKEEFELLDSALSYWGDEKLNLTLKNWYYKLKKQKMNKDGNI